MCSATLVWQILGVFGPSPAHQLGRVQVECTLLLAPSSWPSDPRAAIFGAGDWRFFQCTQVWGGLGMGLPSVRRTGPKRK